MPPPVPDPEECARAASRLNALGPLWAATEDWKKPLGRALVGAGLLTGDHADMTVRRWSQGKRVTPARVLESLEQEIAGRPQWLVGSTERGEPAVAHLVAPRFVLRGEIIDWIDPAPAYRKRSQLLTKAVHLADSGRSS